MALWIAQALLALLMLYTGWLKTFQYDKAKASWPWISTVPASLVFSIGLAELLAVFGLILPQAFMIMPLLTPIASGGTAIVLMSGAILHVTRREYGSIGLNIVFSLLAMFILIGRLVGL